MKPHLSAIATAITLTAAATGCGGSAHRATAPGGCPVTKPGGPRPPLLALMNLGTPLGKPSDPGWYGNGILWTSLPNGLMAARDPSTGLLRTKLGWFRGRPGAVTLTARPVRGAAARFTAEVGSPASYGPTGFVPSVLGFGRAGCWSLRARLGGSELDVVIAVTRARS